MRWLSPGIALFLLAFGMESTSVLAGVITFDDLPSNPFENPIANGYAGLNWTNLSYVNAPTFFAQKAGYVHGIVSLPNIAFNLGGGPADISSATPFTFNGAYLVGAWNDGLQVDVQGFQGSTLVYDTTITAAPVAGPPEFFTFDYADVTRLHFVSFGGIPESGLGGSGEQFGMDNLTVNEPVASVPEPPAFTLLGGVLVAVAFGSWCRRRSRAVLAG